MVLRINELGGQSPDSLFLYNEKDLSNVYRIVYILFNGR